MSYTSTKTTTFPGTTGTTVQNAYNNAIGTYDNTQFTPYTGQLVAPTNSVQQSTMNNEQGLGYYQPMMTSASSVLGNSDGAANTLQGLGSYQPMNVQAGSVAQYAGGTGAGGLSTNGENLSGYMNPYTQSVINSSLQQINNQLATTDNASDAAATTAGAFGGDRAAIVNAQNAYNANEIAAQTISGLNSSNYTNAETQAQADLNREATAGTSQAQLNLQGQQANQQAGLAAAGVQDTASNQLLGAGVQQAQLNLQSGQGNQFAGLQAANLQNTANNSAFQMGTQYQNTSQANDTAAYNQFENAIQFPLQMQQLAGTATNQYASSLLGNATTTQTTPAGSTAAQIVGGLTAGAGLLGAAGGAANGVNSLYNLFGGSSGATTVGTTAANAASNAASDVGSTAASAASDATDGIFDIFARGGRVGYADGGGVSDDDDDGTYAAVNDGSADTKNDPMTMGLAAAAAAAGDAPIIGADPSAAGLGGTSPMPVAAAGGGLPSAVTPTVQSLFGGGGGTGGVVTPDGSPSPDTAAMQDYLAANPVSAATGATNPAASVSGPTSLEDPALSAPIQWPIAQEDVPPTGNLGLMNGRTSGPWASFPDGDSRNATSQVNLATGLGATTPMAAPTPDATSAQGLGAVAPMAPPANAADTQAQGLPGAMGAGDANLPVPPTPPETPPAPGSQIAPGGLPSAMPARVTQSANPSTPLPSSGGNGNQGWIDTTGQGGGQGGAQGGDSPKGLAIQQPMQGTAGAPTGLALAQQNQTASKSGNGTGGISNWLSDLYNKNPGAMALIKAGAAMMSSRDPHFGVALGQGLNAGASELDTIHESQQQQALRMAQQANTAAYQQGMLNIRQQGANTADVRAATGAQRADTYAGLTTAREKLMAAQTELATAKAAAPPRATSADIQKAAVQSLISKGMSPEDAYAQVKNYTATNAFRQGSLDARMNAASAVQANRDRLAAQSATAQENSAARTIMQTSAQLGKPISYADALMQVRAGRAAVGPAPTPASAPAQGAAASP